MLHPSIIQGDLEVFGKNDSNILDSIGYMFKKAIIFTF